MKKPSIPIIVASIIGLIILAVLLWIFLKPATTQPQNAELSATSTATGTSSSSTTTATSGTIKHTSPTTVRSSIPSTAPITFTSPVTGNQWIFQKQHTISWSRASGSPGSLVLLDATTNNTVGWIEQQILLTQNIFPWDTQDVFLSQTSPIKKNILPGNYRLAITFASPNEPVVVSPVFSIIPAAAAITPTANITIKNQIFSPSTITVPQGTQLIFSNLDAVAYHLSISGNGTMTIATSGTATFNTSPLVPGNNYIFYSTVYPSLRLTATITNPNS